MDALCQFADAPPGHPVRFADAGLAKEYAEKAVKHPAGLIDSKELATQMGKGAGLQMKNPLKVINEEYNDTRMGATIYSYWQDTMTPALPYTLSKTMVSKPYVAGSPSRRRL